MRKSNTKNDKNINIADEQPRTKSFTRGWNNELTTREALPIKKNGKVIPLRVEVEKKEKEAENDEIIEEETKMDAKPDQDGQNLQKNRQVQVNVLLFQMSVKDEELKMLPSAQLQSSKQCIGEISTKILANPESGFKKRRDQTLEGSTTSSSANIMDLFKYLSSEYIEEIELALLSLVIVFKDICPSYRIRDQKDEIQLKKETKALRDYELSLLSNYQKFIKALDQIIVQALGTSKQTITKLNKIHKLGITALRCQCELLRHLSYFNFRTMLLQSVIQRACQPHSIIIQLCCETLTYLFKHDIQVEATYEAVTILSKQFISRKFEDIPYQVMKCLHEIKITIHMDHGKELRKKARQDRKKRKKNKDDVEIGLLEADQQSDENIRKKFQADCLSELCMIYFRIIKMMKKCCNLVPEALHGLSRLTHLINIEMVEDLISILRNAIESDKAMDIFSIHTQLLCIHCVLKTLSGPGQELQIDEEIFLNKLRWLMLELPVGYCHWNIVLECIELVLIKKREERQPLVISFVRVLLLASMHLPSSSISTLCNGATFTILSLVHAILLKYPRIRQGIQAIDTGINHQEEDDEVIDLAMKALRESSNSTTKAPWNHDESSSLRDGTWYLPLIRLHADTKYRMIASTTMSKDLQPIPWRIQDAVISTNTLLPMQTHESMQTEMKNIIDGLDQTFQVLPKTLAIPYENSQKKRKRKNYH